MQPLEYMCLSQLSYIKLSTQFRNQTLGSLIAQHLITEDDLSRPELSELKDANAPLRFHTLLNVEPNTTSGFAGVALKSPDGKIVFAFRGTEPDTLEDKVTDAQITMPNLAKDGIPRQFIDAYKFVQSVLTEESGQSLVTNESLASYVRSSGVTFTGHSLGGGLAQFLSCETGGDATTFNAVGISNLLPMLKPEMFSGQIINYVNENDGVGNYGTRMGETRYLRDSNSEIHENGLIGSFRLSDIFSNSVLGKSLDEWIWGSHGSSAMTHKDKDGKTILNEEVHGPSADVVVGTQIVQSATAIINTLGPPSNYIGQALGSGLYIVADSYINTFTAASKGLGTGIVFLGDSLGGACFAIGSDLDKMVATVQRDTGEFTINLLSLLSDLIGSKDIFGRQVTLESLLGIDKKFSSATTAVRVDPLILDLDGNGIQTTNLSTSTMYFDVDANGYAERTAWVGKGDGLLVLDRDGNGKITSGKELFGDRTVLADGTVASSGFAALADFDLNHDGRIDAHDQVFSKLRIWRDANSDGVSGADELADLTSIGITSINVGSVVTQATDVMNNIQQRLGSFTWSNGTQGAAGEYLLGRNASDSRDISHEGMNIPVEIAFLPDLAGAGNVSSLRVAMAQDVSGTLQTLVQQFVDAPDVATRDALMAQILYRWTSSDTIDPTSRGGLIDARQLAVLEKFMGTNFTGTNGSSPNNNAAPMLKQAYAELSDRMYAALVSKTVLKDVVNAIGYNTNESGSITLDFSKVTTTIDDKLVTDHAAGVALLGEFARVMKGYDLQKLDGWSAFRQQYALQSSELARAIDVVGVGVLQGTATYDSITAQVAGQTVAGGDDGDNLYAHAGGSVLYGDAGNDGLNGAAGNDYLDGGAGDDYLYGGTGDDVYMYHLGDGSDTIYDSDGADKLIFGKGITADMITVGRTDSRGSDLVLTVNGSDKITIRDYFHNDYTWERQDANKIEHITFTDGTIWNADTILEKARVQHGYDKGRSYLSGYDDQKNILYAGAAGSNLSASIQGDQLIGGDASDSLWGSTGNDFLQGGRGNDYITGGSGDDTYAFKLGDGQDTIYDASGTDTLQLGSGITADMVQVSRTDSRGSDLILSIRGTHDKMTIRDYFHNDYTWERQDTNKLEHIIFADGTAWSVDQVIEKARTIVASSSGGYLGGFDDQNDIATGSDNYDYISTGGGDDVIDAGAGNDVAYAGDGNDILRGGAGNDLLNGDNGDDLYVGGAGDDWMQDYGGNDAYVFARGDGSDTIYDSVGNDQLIVADGITPEDIVVSRTDSRGSDLVLTIRGTDDKVTIRDYFHNDYTWERQDANKLEQIVFADGSIWSPETIIEKVRTQHATDSGWSYLSGFDDQKNILYAGNAGSVLYARDRGDELYGGISADSLNGGAGDDWIRGGKGDDYLNGGAGNDVYAFGKGDGQDTIYDWAGNDTLTFGDEITPDMVQVSRTNSRGSDLVLSIRGTDDRVTIRDYFHNAYTWERDDTNKLEKIMFAGGVSWSADQVIEKARYINASAEGGNIYGFDDQNDVVTGSDTYDYISTGGGDDVIDAGAGNDIVYAGAGNDVLHGGAGNDLLSGGNGNDIYLGGAGDDYIEDYEGDDTYVFARGDGSDTIYDAAGSDQLIFADGTAPNDIVVSRAGYRGSDLVLIVRGTNDKVTIRDYFHNGYTWERADANKLETIQFAIDGTRWTADQVLEMARTVRANADGGSVSGYDDQQNILKGSATYDYIYAGSRGDALYGEGGDDTLYGGAGNDLLVGGAGSDTLQGNAGDDVYVFNIGDGQDRVYDAAGNDTLRFGNGITASDVILSRTDSRGSDLVLSIKGTEDTVTVRDYFHGDYTWDRDDTNKIEKFVFDDGTIWNADKVLEEVRSVRALSTGGYCCGYDDQQNIIRGSAQLDYVYAGSKGDTIYGNGGDDVLNGGAGDDTFVMNLGDGQDAIYDCAGKNTLLFGEGITTDALTLVRSGDDMKICNIASHDSVTVRHWFSGSNYQLDSVKLADSHSMSRANMQLLVQAMASFGDTHGGMSWETALTQKPDEAATVLSQYWTAPTA